MNRNESIEITSNGKKYVLLPLCFFRNPVNPGKPLADDKVRELYGLKDDMQSRTVYEVEDESKFMLAKIKYGI